MRVLFCLDSFHVGGTETNAVRTMERLIARDVCVEVACFRPEGPLLPRVERAGVPVHPFRIPSILSPRAVSEGWRFRSFVRRGAYDVVHAHDLYSNILLVPWARLAGVPVIASRRWWNETPRPVHRMLNRWSYRLAHRVLVNGSSVATLVANEVPGVRQRIVLVPNYLDEQSFVAPPAPQLAAWRAELGIDDAALVVGCVANLTPVKQHTTIVHAIALLVEEFPRLALVLVGEGPEREAIGQLAQSLGIRERLHFAGLRPQQPSWHYLFDVSVLTSRQEGFPNSVIEAMAAEKPVVVTRVGAVEDAIIPGVNGELVPTPPSDPETFARSLRTLLADPARRAHMGREGRRLARERFSAEAAIDNLLGVYRALARQA